MIASYQLEPDGSLHYTIDSSFQYDQANQLTSGQVGNQNDTTAYDADGKRTSTNAAGRGTDDTITSTYDVDCGLPVIPRQSE